MCVRTAILIMILSIQSGKMPNFYIIDQRGVVAGDIIKKTFKELEDYDAVRFLLEDRMKLSELPDMGSILAM